MSKVEKNETNMTNCSCTKGCPSYVACACAQEKGETLYCAGEIGKSACEFPKKGCICGACKVHEEFNLESGYYCIQGSVDEIDGKMGM